MIETGFSFRNEGDLIASFWSDKACLVGSLLHNSLLRTFPPIRVRENIVNLWTFPDTGPDSRVSLLYPLFSAVIEILQVVG